ncbi:MAG: restriction endonuclease subunit S, partial [Bacteroidaceae bacterium]|nr:restriction endonuclease subunit S [Bacteroidaceae bacterium]
MKDSGIEWIGEIPESWDIGQIGHLYDERKEKVSDRDYSPLSVTMKGIVPQLSTAAKTDAHDDRKLVRKGDFAINSRSDRKGSCGISAYDGSVSLINTILSPRNEMNPQYYDWLFHTTMFADEYYKWGHGIVDDLWTTNWSDMKKIAVPLPTLEEQHRISTYLDRQCTLINKVIEKTKNSIEEYKKLRQAIIT